MTKSESAKIIKKLEVAYPRYYKDFDKEQILALVDLLAENLTEDFKAVDYAVNNIIKTNKFAPSIAEIKDETVRLIDYATTLVKRQKRAIVGVRIGAYDILTGKMVEEYIKQGTPLNEEEKKFVKEIIGISL